jgi:hypothetical protein
MLTNEQLATLKANILADATLAAWAATGRMAEEIAAEYNKAAAPAFVVWRTAVGPEEWDDAILGTTGAATQLDGLTASKRDSLFWALNKTLNPAIPSVRVALEDFCGSQNTLKATLAAVQKRNATRAEKLFATGTGSTAAPATLTYEGSITYHDVNAALALA